MAEALPTTVLGMVITGDLAGVTYVRHRNGTTVAYAKTYPTKAPTPIKLLWQTRFRDAVAAYRTLTDDQRRTLHAICDAFHLVMSGFNLWISLHMTNRVEWAEAWAEDLQLPW